MVVTGRPPIRKAWVQTVGMARNMRHSWGQRAPPLLSKLSLLPQTESFSATLLTTSPPITRQIPATAVK